MFHMYRLVSMIALCVSVLTFELASTSHAIAAGPIVMRGSNRGRVVHVEEFGAKGDSVTDDTRAIMTAITALPLPACVVVRFPPGVFVVTGITITDRCVSLVGSGGASASLGPVSAVTVIRSTTDAPVIKYTMTKRSAGPRNGVRYQTVRDLAIIGSVTAGRAQHGLEIDNRGIVVENVSITNVGGHGVLLTDSVASRLRGVVVTQAHLDGFNIDDTTSFPHGGAVWANVLDACVSFANGGDGFRFGHGATANVVSAPVTEANHGVGYRFGSNASDNVVTHAYSSDSGGATTFAKATARNRVDFARTNSSNGAGIVDLGTENAISGADDGGRHTYMSIPSLAVGIGNAIPGTLDATRATGVVTVPNRTGGIAWVNAAGNAQGAQVLAIDTGVLARHATYPLALAETAAPDARLSVLTSQHWPGDFALAGAAHLVYRLSDPTGRFSTARNNRGTINIYWDPRSATYVLQNESGADVTCWLFVLSSR